MDSAQVIVAVLGAGGGGAALTALITGLFKWLSGASGRERDKNTDLVAQRKNAIKERETAERERDEADRKRRDMSEYASLLRRQLIEAGLQPIERKRSSDTIMDEEEPEDAPPSQHPERNSPSKYKS